MPPSPRGVPGAPDDEPAERAGPVASSSAPESIGARLVFVVSPPRAGSTLLQRMLGSHSAVFTHPEPHLITPLAHLGYYANVDKAPFDHINAAEALRSFVDGLPRGEDDYLDALRAYTDTLYGRMLSASGRERFLDKTPAYALVLPFLARLYPDARYVVLMRHPLAVFSSYANSFFAGDWRAAHAFNPILERYVPAMARFVRGEPVRAAHVATVAYEALVQRPDAELSRLFAFCGLPHEPRAVEYGDGEPVKAGLGDPITVGRERRPVTDSLDKWVGELAGDPGKRALAEQMVARLDDADLAVWGWPRARLWAPLEDAPGSSGAPAPKPVWNRYTVQRRVMLALKKDIDRRPHGRLVRRVKYYCDVLLRE
ncbi:MAG: sulfotransferase [Myxococcales bacterium]|nr:sulfotransferase [Myxococcales bacterium]